MPASAANTMFVSSPIKRSPNQTKKTASETIAENRKFGIVSDVSTDDFLATYLAASSISAIAWPQEVAELVGDIKNTPRGQERTLYTLNAPLLWLLNAVSRRAFDDLGDPNSRALLFLSGDASTIRDTYNTSTSPDVVAVWSETTIWSQWDVSRRGQGHTPELGSDNLAWHQLAATGEAKVTVDGKHQLCSYLRHHLRLRPDQKAVLGLFARAKDYRMFYHDASVMHRSGPIEWELDPLHAFVTQIYKNQYGDCTMSMLGEDNGGQPKWAIKIEDKVFASIQGKPDPGPGQRRFVTLAVLAVDDIWFIKDIWRDARRRFFEGLLYETAHSGKCIPGLMKADYHGYVLDPFGQRIIASTLQLGPGGLLPAHRSKMRIASRDAGEPLEEVKTVLEFLHVMYDVCVVQRNLYRKCRILHRDISDSNIMIVPKNANRAEAFYERCAEGYDEVKYLNQLFDKEAKPRPACNLVDLGNGADTAMSTPGNAAMLAERTGTPKFMARSVSIGQLLPSFSHQTNMAEMPKLEGEALDLFSKHQAKESGNGATTAEQLESNLNEPKPDPQFTHRLFHDAESVFWVIAWTLARSEPGGSNTKKETEWTEELQCFVQSMGNHAPGPSDSRAGVISGFGREWRDVLHEDLGFLCPMLSKMSQYVYPEWARRPDLDDEHVHEALMRLLLSEIVRLRQLGNPVSLNIGARALPTPKTENSSIRRSTSSFQLLVPASNSISTSKLVPTPLPQPPEFTPTLASTSTSQLSAPESTTSKASGSKKRGRSRTDDSTTEPPRRSPRFADRSFGDESAQHHSERESAAQLGAEQEINALHSSLISEAGAVSWGNCRGNLERPNPGAGFELTVVA